MSQTQKTTRLVLTEGQSEFLRGHGVRFAIVHPSSYPAPTAGRLVLDLVEVDAKTGNAAVGVAVGTHRAVKLKAANQAPEKAGEAGA